jgi:hypothetical protein
MMAPKRSRFSDNSTLDNNNGINIESDSNLSITNVSQLSSLQIQQMMANVHKQIEERKKQLNVSID